MLKHRIENLEYPQVWPSRPTGCEHGPRPSSGEDISIFDSPSPSPSLPSHLSEIFYPEG